MLVSTIVRQIVASMVLGLFAFSATTYAASPQEIEDEMRKAKYEMLSGSDLDMRWNEVVTDWKIAPRKADLILPIIQSLSESGQSGDPLGRVVTLLYQNRPAYSGVYADRRWKTLKMVGSTLKLQNSGNKTITTLTRQFLNPHDEKVQLALLSQNSALREDMTECAQLAGGCRYAHASALSLLSLQEYGRNLSPDEIMKYRCCARMYLDLSILFLFRSCLNHHLMTESKKAAEELKSIWSEKVQKPLSKFLLPFCHPDHPGGLSEGEDLLCNLFRSATLVFPPDPDGNDEVMAAINS